MWGLWGITDMMTRWWACDQVMGEHEEAQGLTMALRWKLATIKASSAQETEARAMLHQGRGLQITRQNTHLKTKWYDQKNKSWWYNNLVYNVHNLIQTKSPNRLTTRKSSHNCLMFDSSADLNLNKEEKWTWEWYCGQLCSDQVTRRPYDVVTNE